MDQLRVFYINIVYIYFEKIMEDSIYGYIFKEKLLLRIHRLCESIQIENYTNEEHLWFLVNIWAT